MTCNDYLLKITIRRTKKGVEETKQEEYNTGKNRSFPYRYPNIYGNGLDVVLHSLQQIRGGGKNLNIFRSPSKNEHFLQIYPIPHKFARLSLVKETKQTPLLQSEQISPLPIPAPSFDGPDSVNTIITCPENEEKGNKVWVTNCTNPKTSPFFGNNDHGTACCIGVILEGKQTNVGITHQKTKKITSPWWTKDIREKYNDKIPGTRYLSRFVAYNVEPPFDIVKVSGWFCLGFQEGGESLPYKLDLFNATYACPIIHFPSTVAEVVGDSTKAIIGYGINDCTHRFIVVRKEEIERRLLVGI